MSAYTSIKVSKEKAEEIVFKALRDDDTLKALLNVVLERDTLYNCYRIVGKGEENDDDRL